MAVKMKRAIPDKFKDAPELWPGLEMYFAAFMDLMSSRHMGFGASPIWWETVQNYAEKKGFDEEQTEALHYHIQEMDTYYLNHLAKKSKHGTNREILTKNKGQK